MTLKNDDLANTNSIIILKNLYSKLDNKSSFSWLNGRNHSDSFVICVGAGPWKFNRRKKIQGQAIEKLAGRDLSFVNEKIDWYPLDWQNKFVQSMSSNLKRKKITMEILCGYLKKHGDTKSRKIIYDLAGCPNGAKVLSLFCRDSLKLPSFPIDRHVKKYLIKNNLPTNEDDMVELCLRAGINPIIAAVSFVKAESNMDNPDWSV